MSWLIECSRCAATYEVDRAAIMGGRWLICPRCGGQSPKPAVGPSAAPEGHIRPIPGYEGDCTGGSGKPEAEAGR